MRVVDKAVSAVSATIHRCSGTTAGKEFDKLVAAIVSHKVGGQSQAKEKKKAREGMRSCLD